MRQEALPSFRQAIGKIAFIEQNQTIHTLLKRGNTATLHQFAGKGRCGRNNQQDLINIGGNQFLPEGIGAIKQISTRQNSLNDSCILPLFLRFHPVAANSLAFFPARIALYL